MTRLLTLFLIVLSFVFANDINAFVEPGTLFREVGNRLHAGEEMPENEETLLLLEEAFVLGGDRIDSDEDIILCSEIMSGITILRSKLKGEDPQEIFLALVGFANENFSAEEFTFGNIPEQHPEFSGLTSNDTDKTLANAVEMMKRGHMKNAEKELLRLYYVLWKEGRITADSYRLANKLALLYMKMELPDAALAILRQNKAQMEKDGAMDENYAETIAYLSCVTKYEGNLIRAGIYMDVAEVLSSKLGLDLNEIMKDYTDLMSLQDMKGSTALYSFIEENDKLFLFLTEKERVERWNSKRTEWEEIKSSLLSDDRLNVNDILNAIEYEKQIQLRSLSKVRSMLALNRDEELMALIDRLMRLRGEITTAYLRKHDEIQAEIERVQKQILHHPALQDTETRIYHNLSTYGIADRLNYDETFLSFGRMEVDGEPRYCVVAVTKENPEGRFQILCPVEEVRSFISATERDQAHETVKSRYGNNLLYDMLWRPILESGMVKERVLYSPVDELNTIMFDAIGHDGRYIGEELRFHILSSAEGLEQARRGEDYRPERITSFCAIDFYGDRQELIRNARRYGVSRPLQSHAMDKDLTLFMNEDISLIPLDKRSDYVWLSELGEKYRTPVYLLTGSEASETAFKAICMEDGGALNISTHAYCVSRTDNLWGKPYLLDLSILSHNCEGNSGILLPLFRTGLLLSGAERSWLNKNRIDGIEDGVLNGAELAALDLSRIGLVTLMACETGRGDIDQYEGAIGLRRAFKQAGCGTIISAAWNLESEASKVYMEKFYDALMRGCGIASAHREAQLELIKRFDDPYFWAVFQLVD